IKLIFYKNKNGGSKMSKREERRKEIREEIRLRMQKEKEDFINDINILHNNIDSMMPSIGIKKEYENNYTSYNITEYPKCLTYDITLYKKVYPFNIYYSKRYFKNDIPKKHKEVFKELEKYFNE
ncbi:MAG: hypothetical protein PHS24_04840, partial [Bacilli bacterium]|nr:hypothetical protein [Bacilli bacterium]